MTEEEKHKNTKIEGETPEKVRTKEEKMRTAYKMVNETLLKEHKFWSAEPLGKKSSDMGDARCDSSSQKPTEVKIQDNTDIVIRKVNLQTELSSVCKLLQDHYVEDKASKFSLQYSDEFIKWQLESPYVYPEWNVGIFIGDEIIGFISACSINIRIKNNKPNTAIVNFLCVHREYRKRRLAPLLIKEITKEVNRKGIFTALFTSGEKLPYIFTRSRYYHRILKEGNLVESGFCDPEDIEKITEDTIIFQDSPTVHYRRITEEEVPLAYKMYCDKYSKPDISISADFTFEQFKYYVYGRKGLSDMLISEDGKEFVSVFYLETKTAIGTENIRTAYLSYHTMQNGVNSMLSLIKYLKDSDECDVLNALNLECNTEDILIKSGFLTGDGIINYYLFNWDTELIQQYKNSFIPY
ncbi:uncharacterized protein NEPG_00333 [Nematocida parisii ERTm1]|uniref:uncharacterized protein n=1 Tax=Nematocida parisii (strain ERTm1 / ATCC PRA-289) TaxID=881290 RepID=UPI000264B46F|nr:uncharacterized protein NEPG_00333 [Nematocida parisii ERTm1]EIJ94809.1 hypothetical protein NEPG_00333 [Nematocida parisii ERTm1]KAI5145335.1 glycylpeptide N-tetradecanoyltransferase [Nematocida parisii]|eukprot:XP_013058165.1 hypothetical protein NEPG_00333 [Nematocida parisii ERTm1]